MRKPVTSIIARLLVMQVSNSVLCFRLFKARKLGKLPPHGCSTGKGYTKTRHNVTECETFSRFARLLAKEWRAWRYVEQQEKIETQASVNHLTPFFSRNVADRYNTGVPKGRRLDTAVDQKTFIGQPTYRVLCSWRLRTIRNGKATTRRKGSK